MNFRRNHSPTIAAAKAGFSASAAFFTVGVVGQQGVVVNLVTPIVTIYLLIDWKGLIAAIDRVIPAAQRPTVLMLAGEVDDTISGFSCGQGTICIVLAFYYALALRLIGLNHGILIGLAAGLISFIPYLGSLTGLVLSLCVVVLQFWPSWTLIPVVLGIFFVGQAIADYVARSNYPPAEPGALFM